MLQWQVKYRSCCIIIICSVSLNIAADWRTKLRIQNQPHLTGWAREKLKQHSVEFATIFVVLLRTQRDRSNAGCKKGQLCENALRIFLVPICLRFVFQAPERKTRSSLKSAKLSLKSAKINMDWNCQRQVEHELDLPLFKTTWIDRFFKACQWLDTTHPITPSWFLSFVGV